MIDAQGYRANVGIIILNDLGQVFWGRRVGRAGWQFPQGGMNPEESPEQAMFRELREEVGLQPHHVEVLGCTRRWLRYRLPQRYIRRDQQPLCIGQKQRWFVLRLTAAETAFDLAGDATPEFDQWRWIDYWRRPTRSSPSSVASTIRRCGSSRRSWNAQWPSVCRGRRQGEDAVQA